MIIDCPKCRADTVVSEHHESCGFCGTQLVRHRRRGKGILGPAPTHIREPDIVEAYRLYQTGLSMRAVARIIHPRTDYKTERTCAVCLSDQFAIRGWPTRTITADNTRRGNQIRDAKGQRPGETFYQHAARIRREAGLLQPLCGGVIAHGPKRGQACSNPAMRGDDFCFGHSAARTTDRLRVIAIMRGAWRTHTDQASS